MRKSYSFYNDDTNKCKYNLLYDKAIDLREFKNKISKEVCLNFLYFVEKSNYDWINHFRIKIPSCNNQDISCAITDVYTSYDNKIDSFKQKLQVKTQKDIKYTYYKKNGKTYKKGDVKTAEIIFKSTTFTTALTYLYRYWNDGLIDWLNKNKDSDPKLKDLRNKVLKIWNKYSNRILPLIQSNRERILKEITEHPIQFKSLSFRSCTEMKMRVLNRNKNEQSIYGAYITLSGQNTKNGKLHIPVKYSQSHHGLIDDYDKELNTKNQKVISYTVCFEKDKIRIVLGKDVPDEQEICDKKEYYGIDVNVKHNLFCDKNGTTIDYDRKLFEQYVYILQQTDKKLQYKKQHNITDKDGKITLSKRDKLIIERYQSKIKDMLKRKSSELVKQAISLGKNHIVMENLKDMAKSFVRSDEFQGFKFSRLIRLLNLADLKNIVKSIAHKHNIQVTFIQPHYTSQTCPECGHISRDNRTTQETFCCTECNYTNNADVNSANNIEERLSVDVLRNKLLSFNDTTKIYTPKKLSKNSIITILYDHYLSDKDKINI